MQDMCQGEAQNADQTAKPRKVPFELLTPGEAAWQAAVLGLFAVACLCAAAWAVADAYGMWTTVAAAWAASACVMAAAPALLSSFRAEALRNLRAVIAEGEQQSIQAAILCAQVLGVGVEEVVGSTEVRSALGAKLQAALQAGDTKRAVAVARCVSTAESCCNGVIRVPRPARIDSLSVANAHEYLSAKSSSGRLAWAQGSDRSRGPESAREAEAPSGLRQQEQAHAEPQLLDFEAETAPPKTQGYAEFTTESGGTRRDLLPVPASQDELDTEISCNWIIL